MVKETNADAALAATEVAITSTTKVNRWNHSLVPPLQAPVRLGPFDHLSPPFIPIHVLYIYENPAPIKTPQALSDFIPSARLQTAIARLLDYYPHLTGRLAFEECDGTPYIDRLDRGIDYITATCDKRLDDFKDAETGRVDMTKLPDCGTLLVPPFTPTVESVCNDAVFAVQHTRFKCGAVGVGFRLHHIVCDADGLFQVIRDLAELYRGIRVFESDGNGDAAVGIGTGIEAVRLSQPPNIRSYHAELCAMKPDEREMARRFKPELFTLGPSHGGKTAGNEAVTEYTSSTDASQPKFSGRVIRFSAEELTVLKERAADPVGLGRISTFDALSAHIFQRVYHARMRLLQTQTRTQNHSNNSQDPDYTDLPRGFLTSINLRRPSRLNLPPRYFPNAVVTIFKTLSHSALAHGPLSQIAKVLHELTHSVDPSEVEHTLRWIAAQPDKRRIQPAIVSGLGSLIVTHWSGFGMYAGAELDVDGEGSEGRLVPPVLVGPPMTRISLLDGLAFLLGTEGQGGRGPGGNGEGGEKLKGESIDVSLRLSEAVWEFLDLSVVEQTN